MLGNSNGSGFIAWMERTQKILLFCLMLSIAILVFVQVLLRYVFKAPLMGIEEILLFPTVWLYFLGGANASLERSQIVARVLEVFMEKDKTIAFIRSLASVLSLVVAGWLTYWGWDFLKYSMRMDKVSPTLYIPTIYADAAVFICLLLMSFYTVLEIFHNFSLYKSGKLD